MLFFKPDWTPISFQDAGEAEIIRHKNLDHLSFGHDVETAFLLQESAAALGWEKDSLTLYKAKKMLDHALAQGWDQQVGGFYDEGYYFKGEEKTRIVLRGGLSTFRFWGRGHLGLASQHLGRNLGHVTLKVEVTPPVR